VSDPDNKYVGPPDPPYLELPDDAPAEPHGDPREAKLPADPPYVDSGDDTAETVSKTELHRMTKDELSEYAATHGLSTDGTKDEIHQRIVDAGLTA